jgi:hypothetical protein
VEKRAAVLAKPAGPLGWPLRSSRRAVWLLRFGRNLERVRSAFVRLPYLFVSL